ncbi:MAG: hypothetical protein GF393_09770 [Armatimonadia bacterium]|nr:hypothetical protein [Armatimonadia bacterium]
MRKLAIALATAIVCAALVMPAHARRMLSQEGETVESARAEAQQVVDHGQVALTISTVGFDIDAGSEAESYLQQTATIGGGGYFSASDSGELTNAMGAAAAGQTAPATTGVTITTPQEGDRVQGRVTVAGTGRPGALIIVSTEVRAQDDDELIKEVPGSRHKIAEDGTWQVWVAAPVLPANIAEPVYFVIKARWATRTEESEFATVTVLRAD